MGTIICVASSPRKPLKPQGNHPYSSFLHTLMILVLSCHTRQKRIDIAKRKSSVAFGKRLSHVTFPAICNFSQTNSPGHKTRQKRCGFCDSKLVFLGFECEWPHCNARQMRGLWVKEVESMGQRKAVKQLQHIEVRTCQSLCSMNHSEHLRAGKQTTGCLCGLEQCLAWI